MINYNNTHILRESVLSLCAQISDPREVELIVVDAGSTDASVAVLKEIKAQHPALKLILNTGPTPLWINTVRELGLGAAQGRYVAFTDSDCIYNPKWVNVVLEDITCHPGVSAFYGPRRPDEGRGVGTMIRRLEGSQSRKYLQQDAKLFSQGSPEIYYFVGSNLVVRRDVLAAVGLYDPIFYKCSFEDVDLQERILAAGHAVLYDPRLIIRHNHPLSLAGLLRKSYYSGYGYGLLALKHPHTRVGKWSPRDDSYYFLLLLPGILGFFAWPFFLTWLFFLGFTFRKAFYRHFELGYLIFLPLLPLKAARDMVRFYGAARVYVRHFFGVDPVFKPRSTELGNILVIN